MMMMMIKKTDCSAYLAHGAWLAAAVHTAVVARRLGQAVLVAQLGAVRRGEQRGQTPGENSTAVVDPAVGALVLAQQHMADLAVHPALQGARASVFMFSFCQDAGL
jgi:hypothetical protein